MQQITVRRVRGAESFGRGLVSASILVIGDLMLDRYLWGEVQRISPEAPVPVVRLTSQSERPGGAANVAANLIGLGMKVSVAGFAGFDANGRRLLKILQKLSIDTDAVVRMEHYPTTTKTRIVGAHQQMLRLDAEDATSISPEGIARLMEGIHKKLLSGTAAIILSDYAKGVLGEEVCRTVIAEARSLGIPVLVDPKGLDYSKYCNATVVTPNKAELAVACNALSDPVEMLLDKGEALRQRLNLDFLVFTRGEEGVSIIEAGKASHIPAQAKRVFDVSGAGDTVIATLAAGLVSGLDRVDAVYLANAAAGVVVGKVGTVPIERSELFEILASDSFPWENEKICSVQEILERSTQWRLANKRIVFTVNHFEALEAAHVAHLECARTLGDRLVVAVTFENKTSGPSLAAPEDALGRARVLAGLKCVDAVVVVEPDKRAHLLDALQPDVMAPENGFRESERADIIRASKKPNGSQMLFENRRIRL